MRHLHIEMGRQEVKIKNYLHEWVERKGIKEWAACNALMLITISIFFFVTYCLLVADIVLGGIFSD